jgi:hypothetical protein
MVVELLTIVVSFFATEYINDRFIIILYHIIKHEIKMLKVLNVKLLNSKY